MFLGQKSWLIYFLRVPTFYYENTFNFHFRVNSQRWMGIKLNDICWQISAASRWKKCYWIETNVYSMVTWKSMRLVKSHNMHYVNLNFTEFVLKLVCSLCIYLWINVDKSFMSIISNTSEKNFRYTNDI